MDVEIVKQNGQSFRLSDYGIVQDFVVHSIDRSVVRDPIEGRAGSADYGVEIGDRTIEVPMIFKAADLHDYAHLRDELYGLLDDREPFYIREMRRPKALQYDFVDFGRKPKWEAQTDNEYVNGKQYQVRLNNTLTPEQRSLSGEVSIEFVTSGIPYAETIYTTRELHDNGYSETAEKYGLVDNIDDEKVQYQFTPETDYQPNLIPLTQSAWEVGGWYTTNGAENSTPGRIRTKAQNSIEVVEGGTYTFRDNSAYVSAIQYIYILHYKDGQYIGSSRGWEQTTRGGSLTFTAQGNEIRLSLRAMVGFSILLSFIEMSDNRIKFKLEPGEEHTGFIPGASRFSVYNAGNVTVEPESMMLDIFVSTVHSDNNFTIRNLTTDEEFILKRGSDGSHLRMRGMVVSFGSFANIFRDTNRKFISLAPGDNQFEIEGGTFNFIRFDFKYYYK